MKLAPGGFSRSGEKTLEIWSNSANPSLDFLRPLRPIVSKVEPSVLCGRSFPIRARFVLLRRQSPSRCVYCNS